MLNQLLIKNNNQKFKNCNTSSTISESNEENTELIKQNSDSSAFKEEKNNDNIDHKDSLNNIQFS